MSSPFLIAIALRVHRPKFFLYGTSAALLTLLVVMAAVRFVPDTRSEISHSGQRRAPLWTNPMLPVICLLFFVYVGTETCFGQWVATYARRIESGPHWLATITPSFFWGALLVGRALAPVALKFRSDLTVARAGLVSALLGGISLVAAHGMLMIVIGSLLAGLGLASIFPISVSLLPNWFGSSARQASSLVFASGNTGGAVLPWVLGAVSTHYLSLRLAFCVPMAGAGALLIFYLISRASSHSPRAAALP